MSKLPEALVTVFTEACVQLTYAVEGGTDHNKFLAVTTALQEAWPDLINGYLEAVEIERSAFLHPNESPE